jgi:hypothetical protein
MVTEEYQPMTLQDLIRALQRYQGDGVRSGGLSGRWIAARLQPLLDLAYEVSNSRLSPENQKEMNAFRAAEIEQEIERKRKDVEALERDLKKVRAA